MDSKLLRLLLIGGLALSLNACDDDDVTEVEPCVTHCEGNFSLQCQPDGSIIPVDCTNAGGCVAATGVCSGTVTPTAVCIDGATKCENNGIYTCTNGQWAFANACQYGCNGNACAEQSSQAVCIAGTKKCENNASYICGNNAWIKAADCLAGCNASTNMCNDAGEGGSDCTDGSLQCNGAYVQACSNGYWVTAPTACANGCENGKCKASDKPVDPDDPEDPEDPESCDYFDCTSEYISECDGEGDTALCDAEYIYCVTRASSSDSSCEAGEKAYSSESKVYCMLVGSSEACLDSGSSEDGCEYETQCTGNTLNVCYDLSWIGWGVIKNDTDCAESGMVCATINKESDCHATCTTEGDMGSTCSKDEEYGGEISTAKSCQKGDDGNLYIVEVQTSCSAACNDGKCDVLDENEGKECSETDKDYCNNDILVSCDASWTGTWSATDCKYSYGDDYSCLPGVDSDYECAIPCDAADEGKTKSSCSFMDYYNSNVQYDYVCTKVADGVYSYQWKSGKYCGGECDADGSLCLKVLDNEGEACNADTFTESCKDAVVSYCGSDGTVTAYNCAINDGYTCHVFTSANMANCATETNVCTTVAEEKTSCTDSLFGSYESTVQCLAADNGKNYWMTTAENDCSDYCNDAGTACASGSSSDATCDYYDCSSDYASGCENATNALCDGSYYYCVSRDESSDSSCSDGATAYSAETTDGSVKTYCLSVGTDSSCLGSGGSSSGDYEVCDDTCTLEGGTLCADYCKNEKGSDVCYMDSQYVYCEDPNA